MNVASNFPDDHEKALYDNNTPVQEEVVNFVEVPTLQKVVTTLPVRETVLIERRHNTDSQCINRVIEVPEIKKIKSTVQVPSIQQVIRHVSRKQVVPVPVEIIKYVPRKDVRVIEEERYIKGEKIEVPKIIDVVKEIIIPRFTETFVPTLVEQTIIAGVQPNDQSSEPIEVEAVTYEPVLVPVDIFIPKPFKCPVSYKGEISETIKQTVVPSAQYNLMLKSQNMEIITVPEVYRDLPFRTEIDGTIHFLEPNKQNMNDESSPGIALHQFASKTHPKLPIIVEDGSILNNVTQQNISNLAFNTAISN